MLYFLGGIFLGMAAGVIMSVMIISVGESDKWEDAYKRGYDKGYYQGVMDVRGERK